MSSTHFDPMDLAAMDLWQQDGSKNNHARLERLLNNLPVAMEQELTERQKTILEMHYFRGLTVSQIAAELGISKSTVSRSMARATERLFCVLRYSL